MAPVSLPVVLLVCGILPAMAQVPPGQAMAISGGNRWGSQWGSPGRPSSGQSWWPFDPDVPGGKCTVNVSAAPAARKSASRSASLDRLLAHRIAEVAVSVGGPVTGINKGDAFTVGSARRAG
ncbi:hypothetical protein HPB50_008956 [Hyalomma asiaticum]|uniref:Uncharacterized protein n=1 Tax=Hyalomma asiaticum TaxID=266040 RepID=A0ACB7TB81_HYAAI|nr:hypothetical protein HPB50_008956 [Hyalomma asiaticum]